MDSIKIEGRNKKAFYVATVVGAYRRVLDGEPFEAVADELLAVSHRPYGTGFYFAEAEQACAYDGYEQQTMHVADVVACEPCEGEGVASRVEGAAGSAPAGGAPCEGPSRRAADADATAPRYRMTVRCRNRFSERDELEVLAPRVPVRPLVVRDLTWLPEPDEDDPAPAPQPVAAANRSCALYAITTPDPVPPGAFLRARVFRRSARHG